MMMSTNIKTYLKERYSGNKPESVAINFTKSSLDSMPVPTNEQGEYYVRDNNHRGLQCWVRPTGKKTLRLTMRTKNKGNNSQSTKTNLGLWGAGYELVDMKTVYARVTELEAIKHEGRNPHVVAKLKGAAHSEEVNRHELEAMTFAQAFDVYIKQKPMADATKKRYTRAVYGNEKNPCDDGHLAQWRDLPLREVFKMDTLIEIRDFIVWNSVHGRAQQVTKRGQRAFKPKGRNPSGKGAALVTTKMMQSCLNHTRKRFRHDKALIELIPQFPFDVMDDGDYKLWRKPVAVASRDEYIEEGNLRTWIQAVEYLPTYFSKREYNGKSFRDYLLFILFTGMRADEAASNLYWNGVNFRKKTLFVGETKNDDDLFVPMLPFVEEILNGIKERTGGKRGTLVFSELPSTTDSAGEVKRNPRPAIDAITEILTEQDYWPVDMEGEPHAKQRYSRSPHDIRASLVTYATGLNLSEVAIKALVNHKKPGAARNVTNRYRRNFGVPQLRQAAMLIHDFILDVRENGYNFGLDKVTQ